MHKLRYSILDRRENTNIKNITNLIQTRITFNKNNCFDSFLERIEFRLSDASLQVVPLMRSSIEEGAFKESI